MQRGKCSNIGKKTMVAPTTAVMLEIIESSQTAYILNYSPKHLLTDQMRVVRERNQ